MDYKAKVMELLERFKYKEATTGGVSSVVNNWLRAKASLMERFRKHPYWDEEQKAIVLKQEYSRCFEKSKTENFRAWLGYVVDKYIADHQINKVNGRTISEWEMIANKCYQTLRRMEPLIPYYPELRESDINIFLNATMYEAEATVKEIENNTILTREGFRVSIEDYKFARKIEDLANCIYNDIHDQYLTEESANVIAKLFPEAKCVAGQSTSKAINRICKLLGITAEAYPEYNREFAKFADAVNPLKYTTYTVLSLNILDYLTMSIGHNWSSCHTIDKYKILPTTNSTGYGGCYSAGGLSYAGDGCTIIFYTVDKDFEHPEELWSAEKVKRCNFHVRDDGKVLVQGRVYPDGRDGGDNSLASQFRAVVQSIIAEVFDLPNFWSAKKPSEDWAYSADGHANYEDYNCYSDCNATLNKEIEENDHEGVEIGSEPICICCGYSYDGEIDEAHEWIYCPDCNPEFIGYCANCDERITSSSDDYIRDRASNDVYCCVRCAENADLHFLYDVDEWSSEGYYDEYNHEYYSDYEVEINGNYYYTESHAKADGWVYTDDTERWISRDEAYRYDGCWYENEPVEEEEVG